MNANLARQLYGKHALKLGNSVYWNFLDNLVHVYYRLNGAAVITCRGKDIYVLKRGTELSGDFISYFQEQQPVEYFLHPYEQNLIIEDISSLDIFPSVINVVIAIYVVNDSTFKAELNEKISITWNSSQ